MGPVWEANHVWLIVILVILWTCFPHAFGPIMETLYIPLFIGLVGIVLRGAAFALRGEAATIGEARLLGGMFALSSLITPLFFGMAVGGIVDGRVPVDQPGDAWTSWTGPVSIFAGILAIATGAYLAAVYLAADSGRAGQPDLIAAFRRRALGAGAVGGVLAIGGLFVLRADARDIFDGLTSGIGLAFLIGSVGFGLLTVWLVWSSRFLPARFTAATTVGAVTSGMVVAMRPYLLPPNLTVDQAAAGDTTLLWTFVSLVIGLAVIIPSLTYLYRLTLTGELNKEYHPLIPGDDSADKDVEALP
jgi:cytochrome d ubiquinol oxidase subunit II